MGEHFFDDLARGLDQGTISRRRALKLAGGALLASVVPSLFPREAEARHRRCRAPCKCRRRGGRYLSTGECHCVSVCGPGGLQDCNGNISCLCVEKTDGSGGFCGDKVWGFRASDCARLGCSGSQTCVVFRGCTDAGVGQPCQPPLSGCPSGLGCLNGTCQNIGCMAPCGCTGTGEGCSTNEECCSGQCNGGVCG